MLQRNNREKRNPEPESGCKTESKKIFWFLFALFFHRISLLISFLIGKCLPSPSQLILLPEDYESADALCSLSPSPLLFSRLHLTASLASDSFSRVFMCSRVGGQFSHQLLFVYDCLFPEFCHKRRQGHDTDDRLIRCDEFCQIAHASSLLSIPLFSSSHSRQKISLILSSHCYELGRGGKSEQKERHIHVFRSVDV